MSRCSNLWKRSPGLDADARGVWAGDRPMVLDPKPSDDAIRAAIVRWIAMMASGDYDAAVATAFGRDPPKPDEFRERVETFCVEMPRMLQGIVDACAREGINVAEASPPFEQRDRARVIPMVPELLGKMEIQRGNLPPDAVAWVGFHIPLNNYFAIWTTMGVMRDGDQCVLEFEIFHL